MLAAGLPLVVLGRLFGALRESGYPAAVRSTGGVMAGITSAVLLLGLSGGVVRWGFITAIVAAVAGLAVACSLYLRPSRFLRGVVAAVCLLLLVVSGWPGLEVRAYRHSDGEHGSEPVALLRMDRPSADVLLCLFARVPAWIEFDEPKEGLHFGVEVIDGEEKIGLRNLDDPDVGKLRGTTVKPARAEHRRLDIPALRDRIQAGLGLGGDGELGPAAFALQMVKVPEQMVFQTAQTG